MGRVVAKIEKQHYQLGLGTETTLTLGNGGKFTFQDITPEGVRALQQGAQSARAQELRRSLRKKFQRNKAKRNR